MKVLIAVDATPSCRGVVQAAAARPWPAGSSFLLATAISAQASIWGTPPNVFSTLEIPGGRSAHSLAIGVRIW
jgi:hypothetical protein